VIVVVEISAGKVVAPVMVRVEVVHGGVVSMQEQRVLTKELACWTSDEKRVSRGSGFLVVGVGLGFVRLLRAPQVGIMVTVVTALAVTYTTGGVLLLSVRHVLCVENSAREIRRYTTSSPANLYE
jgi:hypothetical protein